MQENQNLNIPEQYRPISAWGYFGYSLLFTLPLIGFIFLIIYSFSDENINRRNYARSMFCLLAVVIVVVLIMAVVALGIVAMNS